jgi:3-dehydro-4-phosphotetronate decarboxylase
MGPVVTGEPTTAEEERAAREALCRAGRHLTALGLSPGSSGNLSVRLGDRVLITPTGTGLGALDPAELAVLTMDGVLSAGPKPSKEYPLHLAFYRRARAAGAAQPDRAAQAVGAVQVQPCGAVVHLHSTHAAAASCLPPWSPASALPPLTPYLVMRVGQVPSVPYAAPGNDVQGPAIEADPRTFRAVLLQNHGPVVTGPDLAAAVDAAVEVEETARLHLLLAGHRPTTLSPAAITELTDRYGTPWDTTDATSALL